MSARRHWSTTDAQHERARGRAWFGTLRTDERNDLGDALVLGGFDWRDWGFDRAPSGAFLGGADDARIDWEIAASLAAGEAARG